LGIIEKNYFVLLQLVVMCVGEIFLIPLFFKGLKTFYQSATNFMGSIQYTSPSQIRDLIPIMLVPRYKLPLCHTPIKSYLLGFLGVE